MTRPRRTRESKTLNQSKATLNCVKKLQLNVRKNSRRTGTSVNFRQCFATSSNVRRKDLSRLEQMRAPRHINDRRIGAAQARSLVKLPSPQAISADRGRPDSLAAGVPSHPLSHLELWVTADSKPAIELRYLQNWRRSVQSFWKELYPPRLTLSRKV